MRRPLTLGAILHAPRVPLSPSQDNTEQDVEQYLRKRFENAISRIVRRTKTDLDMPNHLVAPPQLFLQLCFRNVGDLYRVRKFILPLVRRNQDRKSTLDAYADAYAPGCALPYGRP